MTNRHPEAVKECEEGIRLSPDSDRATGGLLNALRAAGRPLAEIMRLADLAVARFRESEALLAFSAEIYYEAGEYLQSAELLRQLIALKPDASIYHGLLADVSLKLERDEEALSEARTALKLEPSNPYANYSMGLIFFELGQHEEAAESFGKVSPGIPRLRRAEFYRALSEEGRGRSSEAIKILEGLVSRFPDDFEFQYQLGSSLNGASRYEDAVGPLTKARQLRPKSLEAAAGLGLALFESGQLDRAVPVLEEALRISPGNEVVTMFLNVTRARQSLIPQIDELKRFAKENPQHVDVRRTLIQAFSFSRRVDEAEPYLKELLALGPKDLKVYSYVGVAYSTAGRLDKAMEVHLKSLEVGENPGAYLNIASIYAKRGDFERAAAAYGKVLELQPNSPDTMVIFGTLLLENGKRREALDLFKRSIAIKPTNGVAIFKAGILSAKFGERDNALQYLEMLRPVRPDLARTLGRCLRLRIW
jgi:tetratricopeptide (TPR) repeat protein